MKIVWKLLTGALVGAMLAAGPATAQNKPEKAKVTIGLPVHTSTFLPLYMAEEAGFFKEEGLEAEIVAFRGGTEVVRAMVAGAVDIGVGAFAEALVGIESGQPIKVFYAGFNMAVFDWYSVPSIKTLEQAKGARFGITTVGSSTDFLTRYALKSRGIDPRRDVRIVQGGGSGPRMAAMAAGQLEVNIFATPEKFMAADQGYNLLLRQSDLAEDYPFHVFYGKQDFITTNPTTIRAVLRAFVKGVRLAKADKARAVKLLVAKTGIEEKYSTRAYDDFMDKIYEDGRMPSDTGMKAFWDMGIENGTYKEAWAPERYLLPTFMQSFNEWKPN